MRTLPLSRIFLGSALLVAFSLGIAQAAVTDKNIYVPSSYTSFLPPDMGGSYTDSNFGTSIKRISSAAAQRNAETGNPFSFITHEYSTMSPFNQDNSRILLLHQSYFALYDAAGKFVKDCPFQVHASSEPRWSRTDANILYFISGNQLKQYNAGNDAVSVVHTFSEYSTISGKGESDISLDGDHFVFAGDNRYVFLFELSSKTKSSVLDTAGHGFDSLYVTPNNNVTVTWFQAGTGRFTGIELFDRNMTFQRQVSRAGGHMDVGRDVNGDEILLLINAADPTPVADNAIVKIRLSDGKQTPLISLDWNLAVHVSATDNSGWVFIETYAPGDPMPTGSWPVYTNELLQIKLDGTEVRRLAHHRSRPFNSYNYGPRAAASRDGSKLIFSSNYGLQSILGLTSEYSDVYMISGLTGGTTGTGDTGTGGTGGTGTTNPPAGSNRIEQNNPAVVYSGSWLANSLAGHSAAGAALSMERGSRATFNFSGTGIRWIGYQDEWSGKAKVMLDGALVATVNTYASPARFQAVVFEKTGLSAGSHTLVIEVAGNSERGKGWIWIDAFEVVPSGTGTGTGNPPAGTVTRIEQDNAVIQYAGDWFIHNSAGHSGGSAKLAMDAGSAATVTFTGTSITWIGHRDEWSGIARVTIDGSVQEIDTYATPEKSQAVVYTVKGLASGSHTLKIEATGRKSAASGGAWVWIDAIEAQ
jgi:hypothetical protein